MHSNNYPSRRKYFDIAFTLVELLVVIAIISMLAAMLMPVLESAMNSAHQLSCMNNEKQLGVGLSMYTDDYEGYPPPLIFTEWIWPWLKVVPRYYLGYDSFDSNNKLNFSGVTICPNDTNDYPDTHPTWNSCYGSYGTHLQAICEIDSTVRPYKKWDAFVNAYGSGNPSSLGTIFETGGWDSGVNYNTGYFSGLEHRHLEDGDGMNIMFADFHVEFQMANAGGTRIYEVYDVVWKHPTYAP